MLGLVVTLLFLCLLTAVFIQAWPVWLAIAVAAILWWLAGRILKKLDNWRH